MQFSQLLYFIFFLKIKLNLKRKRGYTTSFNGLKKFYGLKSGKKAALKSKANPFLPGQFIKFIQFLNWKKKGKKRRRKWAENGVNGGGDQNDDDDDDI